MKTLEALYYGVINSSPYDREIKDSYQELLQLVVRNETALTDTLTDTQKDTFDKFKDCTAELHSMIELNAFIDGFTLASKIMTEVMAAE